MTLSVCKKLFLALEATSRSAPAMLTFRIGLCLLCMWAVFGMIILETRRHAWSDATTFGTDVAMLVETAIAREFEIYDRSVRAAVEASTDPAVMALPSALKRKAMFEQSGSASDLGRVVVLDRSGRAIEASKDDVPLGLDYSDRDYFEIQRSRADAGLFVGGPFSGRITHRPSIGLSRRRVTSNGSFDGVVVGTMQLSFFERLFSAIHLPANSTVALMKPDGTLLTRVPFRSEYVGRKVLSEKLAKVLIQGNGIYEKVAGSDGVRRLFAFRKVGELPLYVTVGLSTREIYRNWRWEMLVIGIGFAILTALILLLGFNLAGELRRRSEAEHRLAELASTDYLTMLANRRRFDEVLEAEWRRGARARSPLSLLMVDGDFFKAFNDTYGHIEGDRALRLIAKALRDCVDRAGDLVARYGGEEFAVLLPGTTGDGALIVATAVRAAINAMELTHAATPSGCLTVSIGVACRTPDSSLAAEVLVEAADAALYVAKGEGRDRVVLAGRPTSPLGLGDRRVA